MQRRPPADVRRQLRKEANFGCVVCGTPIIQYHHIVPFSEEEHHDPDKMVVLCPNHHDHAGPDAEALTPNDLYEYKKDPHISDIVDYDFYYESSTPTLNIAETRCQLRDLEEMIVLEIHGEPIIEMAYRDGVLQFSVKLYNEEGDLIAELDENEWWADTNNVWDLEYRANHFKVWHDRRDIGLKIEYDSETDRIDFYGGFYYRGTRVNATPSKIELPMENVITGGAIIDCPTAISIH